MDQGDCRRTADNVSTRRMANRLLALALCAIITLVGWVYITQDINRAFVRFALITGAVAPLCIAALTWRAAPLGTPEITDAKEQLRRIIFYLLFAITANVLFLLLHLTELPKKTLYSLAEGGYALVWTFTPIALIGLKVWRWPKQSERIGKYRLVAAAIFALVFSLIYSLLACDTRFLDATPWLAVPISTLTFTAAVSEELVFRVMFLSYLAAVLRSPLAALIVSSSIFGLAHFPFNLFNASTGLPKLQDPVAVAVTSMMMQTAIGIFLGTIWMGTRSLLIAGSAHALFNLSGHLNEAIDVWG